MIRVGRHSFRQQVMLLGKSDPMRNAVIGNAEPIRFASPRDAHDFLRRLGAESGDMEPLRRLCAEEMSSTYDKSDHEILQLLAAKLASGQVRATVVTPPRSGPLPGEAAQPDPKPGKAPEQEQKPNPIVPIEYIILARLEANETTDDTRRLNAKIEEICFIGFSRNTPRSVIAGTYPDVADAEQLHIERESGNLEAKVGLERYSGWDKTRPPPDVAPVYVQTAEAEHKSTSWQAARFADRMDELRYERHDPNRETSTLAVEYPEVAKAEVKQTGWAMGLLSESVDRLRYEPTIQNREASVLADAYTSTAKVTSRDVSNLLLDVGKGLDPVRWVKEDPAARLLSQLAAEFKSSAATTGNEVSKLLLDVAPTLDPCRWKEDKPAPRDFSSLATAIRTATQEQVDRTGGIVSRFTAELSKLTGVPVPPTRAAAPPPEPATH